ncbi:energy transducer TonB [Actimicrobium sp. CCI2.3]|uniref:energy transducer TonB n=1 Tax=Actimicrobium sp. CCI2.3 TaxID=3048616 RepID=UPI002AB3C103|nr:energy transducer TonB [Actimicrobium sp. CCI2.3]MDY7574241.1 energy transducer TonB [Actimicrobium sp. CCI2.3]MEB0022759.1 energy transducer TonB [Actimicrobium sp. CCI2.3]
MLFIIGLHYGFWLLLTTRMPPRLPVPRGALIVQLIATPLRVASTPPPELARVSGMSSVPALEFPASSASSVSPSPALARLPARPVVEIREVLPDELALDMAEERGYRDAQQVDQRVRALADLLPVYPQPAFERRENGRVLVEIMIDAHGNIDALHLLAATTGFAASALAAFEGMHFDPAMLDGRPVPSRLLVELTYRLSMHIDTSKDR